MASAYGHGENRQQIIVASCVTVMVLSGVSVALRLFCRIRSRACLWYDDYLIVAALLFSYAGSICILIAVHFDFGKHANVARPDAVPMFFKMLYLLEQFYPPAVNLTKISILMLYGRLFPTPRFRRYLYGMGIFIVLWWMLNQVTNTVQCIPLHYFWTQWTRNPGKGHCIDTLKYYRCQAFPNIITDIILLILPLPEIWKLRLPQSQKMALSGIFCLGGFVTFCSIYRLVIFFKLPIVDITWTSKDSAIWTIVEPNLGVVSACLPTLRPLYRVFSLKKRFSYRKKLANGASDSSDDFSQLPEVIDGAYGLDIGGSTTTTTSISKAAPNVQVDDMIPLDVIYVTEEVYWSSSPATPRL